VIRNAEAMPVSPPSSVEEDAPAHRPVPLEHLFDLVDRNRRVDREVVIARARSSSSARTVVSTCANAEDSLSGQWAFSRMGAGIVSLTSTMESDGITLMNPRNRRKKKAKLPMTIIVSVGLG